MFLLLSLHCFNFGHFAGGNPVIGSNPLPAGGNRNGGNGNGNGGNTHGSKYSQGRECIILVQCEHPTHCAAHTHCIVVLRMGEGNIFSLCQFTPQRVPHLPMKVPHQVLTGDTHSGDTPILPDGGTPLLLGLDGSTPIMTGWGTSPSRLDGGMPPPPPSRDRETEQLRGGGMPLVFTQEHFLVE